MKRTATRVLEFDAGHRVLGHANKCRFLHGHRYKAEITVSTFGLDSLGMVIDFGIVKERVGKWIDDHWDHNMLLNSADPLAIVALAIVHPEKDVLSAVFEGRDPYLFNDCNPTAEVIANELFFKAKDLLPEVSVEGVKIYETPNCFAEFKHD